MQRICVALVALAWVVLASEARADTVYLTDGQSLWGQEAYEEGDSVVIVRPGGNLRILKSRVSRIEHLRSTLPPFYAPPQTAPEGEGSRPAAPPSASARPSAPGTPGQPGTPAPPGGTGGTTQLPPPPPPPAPGTPR